ADAAWEKDRGEHQPGAQHDPDNRRLIHGTIARLRGARRATGGTAPSIGGARTALGRSADARVATNPDRFVRGGRGPHSSALTDGPRWASGRHPPRSRHRPAQDRTRSVLERRNRLT